MDPNVVLNRIRELVAEEMYDEPIELAELINSLDVWLSLGGFLPISWRANREV